MKIQNHFLKLRKKNAETAEIFLLSQAEPHSEKLSGKDENRNPETTENPASQIIPQAISMKPVISKTDSPKSTSYTYKDRDNNEITTKWVKGIIPPMMGDGGDFYEEKILTREFYVAPQDKGKGWYDVNKNTGDRNIDDSRLCSGVAAANMLHWWLDQNAEYVDRFLK